MKPYNAADWTFQTPTRRYSWRRVAAEEGCLPPAYNKVSNDLPARLLRVLNERWPDLNHRVPANESQLRNALRQLITDGWQARRHEAP
jgi:hypothetical protein